MKRIRVEVCPRKRAGDWEVTVSGQWEFRMPTQREAVAVAVRWCNAEAKAGKLLTLKIKRPNGQIRDERTYPRSSDPRRSKG